MHDFPLVTLGLGMILPTVYFGIGLAALQLQWRRGVTVCAVGFVVWIGVAIGLILSLSRIDLSADAQAGISVLFMLIFWNFIGFLAYLLGLTLTGVFKPMPPARGFDVIQSTSDKSPPPE